PNSKGEFVSLSTFATQEWVYGAQQVVRYDALPAMELQGSPAPGVSTGEAMEGMERLASQLPPGFSRTWSRIALEEKAAGDGAMLLYLLAIAAVCHCLADLYESWPIPVSVILEMPVGVLGPLIGAWTGGQQNGVYFQVGMRTVI